VLAGEAVVAPDAGVEDGLQAVGVEEAAAHQIARGVPCGQERAGGVLLVNLCTPFCTKPASGRRKITRALAALVSATAVLPSQT
jgi:hypothetical protein